jgi:ribosomal protein S18 acetylase RimI-like enzyme
MNFRPFFIFFDMKNILIREATVADAEAIAHVHVDSWRETYAGIVSADHLNSLSREKRAEAWGNMLQEEKSRRSVFVAEEAGVVKGFVNGGPARRADFGFAGELYALYTLKQIQGRGAGRRLFEKARNSLVLSGIMDMYLWVLKDNPTLGFYRHMGGNEFARETITIGGNDLEEVALAWKKI